MSRQARGQLMRSAAVEGEHGVDQGGMSALRRRIGTDRHHARSRAQLTAQRRNDIHGAPEVDVQNLRPVGKMRSHTRAGHDAINRTNLTADLS